MNEKILLADDHGIVRMGLASTIKRLRPNALIREANNFEAVMKLADAENYDLMILDINMPNGSFQKTVEYIKIKQPDVKILVFSALDEEVHAMRYIRAGADGYLNKLSGESEVQQALKKMFAQGNFLSENLKDNLIFKSNKKNTKEANPFTSLSNREMDIATRLMKGLRLKDISNELNIHISTISTYKARIFEKISVQSIPEMIEIFKFYEE